MGAVFYIVEIETNQGEVFTAELNDVRMRYIGRGVFAFQSADLVENKPITIKVYDRDNRMIEQKSYLVSPTN